MGQLDLLVRPKILDNRDNLLLYPKDCIASL